MLARNTSSISGDHGPGPTGCSSQTHVRKTQELRPGREAVLWLLRSSGQRLVVKEELWVQELRARKSQGLLGLPGGSQQLCALQEE